MGWHKEQVQTGLTSPPTQASAQMPPGALWMRSLTSPLVIRDSVQHGAESACTLTVSAKLHIARQGLGGTGSLLELMMGSWGSSWLTLLSILPGPACYRLSLWNSPHLFCAGHILNFGEDHQWVTKGSWCETGICCEGFYWGTQNESYVFGLYIFRFLLNHFNSLMWISPAAGDLSCLYIHHHCHSCDWNSPELQVKPTSFPLFILI